MTRPNRGSIIASLLNHERSVKKYYSNPNFCIKCKTIIRISKKRKPSIALKMKFCGHSCAAKSANTHFPKRQKQGKCVSCETSIYSSRKFCHICFKNRLKSCPDNTLSSACKRADAGKFNLVRDNARKIFKKSQNNKPICAHCGYSKHVEICHRKPIREFSPDSLLKEVNSLENLIPLCPNCHWEFDKGFLRI